MTEIGKRLVVNLIDEYARDQPTRPWVSAPVDNSDISKGYRDITFREFANAINRAASWISDNITSNGTEFETIAYAGPKDLRYPIIAVAALKCGKKLLMCSPFASLAAQSHLLSITECTTYMHATSLGPLVQSVIEAGSKVSPLEVPELDAWLSNDEAKPFPYNKTWEEAESDPWMIFHTSGTTGMPKPIVYTNWMFTAFDAAKLMPEVNASVDSLIQDRRYYVPLPMLHVIGMITSLQWPVFARTVLVIGPPGPVTPTQTVDILIHGKVDGTLMPPSLIEDIIRGPNGLTVLRQLYCVFFGGAPIARQTAEKLVGHCILVPAMGSTEAGGYFSVVRNEDDWDYYSFRKSMGIKFEQRTETLYELVFHRQPELERWQQIFKVYPDLDVYPTKDLFAPHPSRPDLWRYSGRTDDLVILSHGEGLYATGMEAAIQKHPDVRTAIIGGQGRPRPFVIIELVGNTSSSKHDKEAKLDEIWPCIEEANKLCSDYVSLRRELVIFSDPARPFPLTAKDTVLRQPTLALYQLEIEQLYPS